MLPVRSMDVWWNAYACSVTAAISYRMYAPYWALKCRSLCKFNSLHLLKLLLLGCATATHDKSYGFLFFFLKIRAKFVLLMWSISFWTCILQVYWEQWAHLANVWKIPKMLGGTNVTDILQGNATIPLVFHVAENYPGESRCSSYDDLLSIPQQGEAPVQRPSLLLLHPESGAWHSGGKLEGSS